MAENGLFRSSMRGFNRQDVLTYIDSLQAENEQRMKALQEELDAANTQIQQANVDRTTAQAETAAVKAENDRLEELINEHNRVNRELREKVEHLPELEALRNENAQVAAKLKEQTDNEAAIAALRSENAALQAEVAALREKESKYLAVAAGLEEIAAQTRRYSLNFLGASCKRSEECLDEMEKMAEGYENELSELRRRIAEARGLLEEQSNAAGIHLDEMLEKLLGKDVLPVRVAPQEESAPVAKEETAPTAEITPAVRVVKQRAARKAERHSSWPDWL